MFRIYGTPRCWNSKLPSTLPRGYPWLQAMQNYAFCQPYIIYCQNIPQISIFSIYFMISAVYCNTNVQSSGSDSHESQCALPSGTHLPFLLSAQPSIQAKHTALLHVAHPTGHFRHSRRFLSAKYPSGQTLEHVPDRAYRPGRHVMHCVSLEPLHVSHDE